jgi:hypothetical protein
MIKKNTKVIFENGENRREEEMVGGIPLSKGEIIKMHQGEEIFDYEVAEKTVDCFLDGEDQIVNITYIVRKNEK